MPNEGLIYITPGELIDKIKKVDGSDSGLDADLLDGQHGSHYAKDADLSSHVNDKSNPHAVTAEQLGADNLLAEVKKVDGADSGLDADQLDGQHGSYYAKSSDLSSTNDNLSAHIADKNNPHDVTAAQLGSNNLLTEIKKVDGGGSGLDADLLDGQHGSYFAKASDLSSHVNDTGNPHNVTAAQLGASNILTEVKKVDGEGSQLDADKLDGHHYFDVIAPSVDLTNATEDYYLIKGETAYYIVENVVELLLHIKTHDGDAYELRLLPNVPYDINESTDVPVHLYPNNATSGVSTQYTYITRTQAALESNYSSIQGFYIGSNYSFTNAIITNRTLFKAVQAYITSYGTAAYFGAFEVNTSIWKDKTTLWTSLGKIDFGRAWSGVVLVKRIF